jgi:single-stranded DNA-binding protein
MSKVGVKLKIDVSKIDKNLLFKGTKGVYLDATVFINLDEPDQYDNNGMITQDETKENREGGKNGPILGNCKVFWKDGGQHSNHSNKPANKPAAKAAPEFDTFDDDIPF